MATVEKPSAIPPELMAELQAVADRAAKGIKVPEAAVKSCEEMDAAREELRRRFGEMNIAVELIRDAREG